MYKRRVLKHICYFDKYQQAWKRLLYLILINMHITHKIFLQALRDASQQLKQNSFTTMLRREMHALIVWQSLLEGGIGIFGFAVLAIF